MDTDSPHNHAPGSLDSSGFFGKSDAAVLVYLRYSPTDEWQLVGQTGAGARGATYLQLPCALTHLRTARPRGADTVANNPSPVFTKPCLVDYFFEVRKAVLLGTCQRLATGQLQVA